jgi:hypothetical protein
MEAILFLRRFHEVYVLEIVGVVRGYRIGVENIAALFRRQPSEQSTAGSAASIPIPKGWVEGYHEV